MTYILNAEAMTRTEMYFIKYVVQCVLSISGLNEEQHVVLFAVPVV
jgi:hypothetical protein